MGFKKGDKLKCIDDSGMCHTDLTVGKVYTALEDQGGTCVMVTTDNGEEFGPYTYRFELVADKPALPTLKPGMRVVLQAGYEGVVVRNSKDELAISLSNSSWSALYFTEIDDIYRDYNIVEVYEAPAFWDALRLDKRGALVWQAEDAAKAASIKAADDAVAEAQAALHAAQAARAAL